MITTEILEDCQLEWQKDRGVLYVHNKATGATVLRICGLPKSAASLAEGQIDIRATDRASMPEEA